MALYEVAKVKAEAQNNWDAILRNLAPQLFLGNGNPTKHHLCPVHGGKDGFRLFADYQKSGGCICNTCGSFPDGFATLKWANNWSFRQALEAVGEFLGTGRSALTDKEKADLEKAQKEAQQAERLEKEKKDNQTKKTIKSIWDGCSSLKGSVVETYLKSRGIELSTRVILSGALKYHASLMARDNENAVTKHPAMVAEVTDRNGQVVALHRTFLSETGCKADMDNPKKITHSLGMEGASIKLGHIPKSGVLGIAEGIETALSVNCATGMTCWATVSSTIMRTFVPPKEVKRLIIWADYDDNGCGQKSAIELKNKLRQIRPDLTVLVVWPKNAGQKCDWNDVLMGKTVKGFPSHSQICSAIKNAEQLSGNAN